MRLRVVVAAHCPSCSDAVALAQAARSWFPDLEVEVLDLDAEGVHKPAPVVAVPTFLVDGQVVALGNPVPEEFRRRLARRLGPPAPRVRGAAPARGG